MDHDLLMMIYGAIIGTGSSILTSLFQAWIAQREYERRQAEERDRQLRHISIPTPEEIRELNAGGGEFASRRSATSTILIIFLPFVFLIYRTHDPVLSLALTAILTFVATRIIFRRRRG